MGYLVCDKCKAYYKLPKGSDPDEFRSSCGCGDVLKYYDTINENSMRNFDNLICPNCTTENPKNSKFCLDCGGKLDQFATYAKEQENLRQTKEENLRLTKENQIKLKSRSEHNFKFCPSCGNENLADAAFCKVCGKELEDMAGKCPYCAEEINPNAIKCKHCGEWLNKKAKPQDQKEDHNGAVVLGYIFSFLGGLLGLFFAIYLSTLNDKKANRHGMIMSLIFVYWILLFSWIYPFFFYFILHMSYIYILYIVNILILLIFGVYSYKRDVTISDSRKLFILSFWAIIIILIILNSFIPFILVYLFDAILILAIYMVTDIKNKETRA